MFEKSQDTNNWWEESFSSDNYLVSCVDFLTPKNTQKEVDFIESVNPLDKNQLILDLCCGQGRHCIELAKRGYCVIGLDYSNFLLQKAKADAKKAGVEAEFKKGDMRHIPYKTRFDIVLNLFTSFGYFSDEENEKVIKGVSESLKKGGRFLIDLQNSIRRIGKILSEGRKDSSGRLVRVSTEKLSTELEIAEKETLDPLTFSIETKRMWQEDGENKEWAFKTRLYSYPELKHLLECYGLRVQNVWGDFSGSPYSSDSKRMIVLSRKE